MALCGCGPSRVEMLSNPENYNAAYLKALGIQVIEVDSCEYLVYHGYVESSMTHKGNCKNH